MWQLTHKRIASVLVAVIVLISVILMGISPLPQPLVVLAATNAVEFDNTNVLDDLKNSTTEGQPFDIKKYPRVDGAEPRLINFVEYCYSYKINMQTNYGLYLYIYNPGSLDIDTNSLANKVQLAVSYDVDGAPNDYENFNLKFCSTVDSGEYKGLFYKFRIIDHKSMTVDSKSILERVNSNERRYDVSGFDLVTKGQDNAAAYTIGGTYKYTGYAKGYGADSDAPSNLKCSINELETVKLTVNDTFFRTGVSDKGVGHQNQVNSVYFSVPNALIEKYGSVQKIKAEWWEYKTEHMFVTKFYDAYTDFKRYVNKILPDSYDSSVPFKIYTFPHNAGEIGEYADWGYNTSKKARIRCNYIPYVFYANTDLSKYTQPEGELRDYIKNYQYSTRGYLPIKDGKTISADLFQSSVDDNRIMGYNEYNFDINDDTFNLLSYDSTHSGWQKFWEYGFWPPETSGDYMDMSPIVQVQTSDLSSNADKLSKDMMIDPGEVSEFRDYCSTELLKQQQPILFRFAQTDYFARTVCVDTPRNGGWSMDGDGMIAYQTLFYDFKVLHLTFNRAGKYTVIAAVSSPIDIINPITFPPTSPGINWWLLLAFGFLALILIVMLIKLVPSLIYGVLALPGKVIGGITKSVKDSKERRRVAAEKKKEDKLNKKDREDK